MDTPLRDPHEEIKRHLGELLDDLMRHDGFGRMGIEIRLLKRGQKEVLIDCGRQYRYVVDFAAGEPRQDSLTP